MNSVAASVPKAPFAVLRGPLRDMANRALRGTAAPRAQERIWVNPSRITRIYTRNPLETPDFKRQHSGMVIEGDWDGHTEPLDASWKVAACLARFRDGMTWQETGVFERMAEMMAQRGAFDSCRTMDDVKARYAGIDALFDKIRRQGFRDDTQWQWGAPRLPGGVFIHIDRDGSPIFGAIGNHRMAIARALGLSRIPAQLGVVHPQAIAGNALRRYRDLAA